MAKSAPKRPEQQLIAQDCMRNVFRPLHDAPVREALLRIESVIESTDSDIHRGIAKGE